MPIHSGGKSKLVGEAMCLTPIYHIVKLFSLKIHTISKNYLLPPCWLNHLFLKLPTIGLSTTPYLMSTKAFSPTTQTNLNGTGTLFYPHGATHIHGILLPTPSSSNVPRELGRFLGDVSGMAEYVTSRESVLFCRHSSCWMLRMGPNRWKRVRKQI